MYGIAGLRIFRYEDWLPSSSIFTDSNALRNTRKEKIQRKRYLVRTCVKIFRKFSGMLGNFSGSRKLYSKLGLNILRKLGP